MIARVAGEWMISTQLFMAYYFARQCEEANTAHAEIGILFGGGLLMMLQALRAAVSEHTALAIDPLDGYYGQTLDPVTGLAISYENVAQNIQRLGFEMDRVHLARLRSESPEALAEAGRFSLASLWIDGDHSYEGVKRDWQSYSPLVMPGGYVLFDNYHDGCFPGVDRFLDIDLLPDLGGWSAGGQDGAQHSPAEEEPWLVSSVGTLSYSLCLARRRNPFANRLPRRVKLKTFVAEGCVFEVTTPVEEARVLRLGEEPDFLRLVLDDIKPGERLFDVGSCVGLYALHAARRGAKVVAFEPDPGYRARLERNIQINGLGGRVAVVGWAVSDRKGHGGSLHRRCRGEVPQPGARRGARFRGRQHRLHRLRHIRRLTADPGRRQARH